MELRKELTRAGLMTGPLVKVATSHSDMERTRKALLGMPQFVGGEQFLVFGNDVHAGALVNARSKDKTVTQLVKVIRANPVFKEYMMKAECEVKIKTKLDGVLVNFILDIHQKHLKRGADLKTTSCTSDAAFVESAIKYGYFRQAATYMRCAKLESFLFIGVQKVAPHKIYLLEVTDYPDELKYAREELNLLLYIFKHYGKINTK